MGDRCKGGCCREFALPRTPRELEEAAAAHLLSGDRELGEELAKIAHLAVPGRLLSKGDLGPTGHVYEFDAPTPLYTCRFFDGANCTNYDARPNMCRDYPYGRPCEHGDACEYDDARAGRVGGREPLPREEADGNRHLPVVQ